MDKHLQTPTYGEVNSETVSYELIEQCVQRTLKAIRDLEICEHIDTFTTNTTRLIFMFKLDSAGNFPQCVLALNLPW